jgi:hypothetical protein
MAIGVREIVLPAWAGRTCRSRCRCTAHPPKSGCAHRWEPIGTAPSSVGSLLRGARDLTGMAEDVLARGYLCGTYQFQPWPPLL